MTSIHIFTYFIKFLLQKILFFFYRKDVHHNQLYAYLFHLIHFHVFSFKTHADHNIQPITFLSNSVSVTFCLLSFFLFLNCNLFVRFPCPSSYDRNQSRVDKIFGVIANHEPQVVVPRHIDVVSHVYLGEEPAHVSRVRQGVFSACKDGDRNFDVAGIIQRWFSLLGNKKKKFTK